jgi:MtN3 and saliva related transmembrane protein
MQQNIELIGFAAALLTTGSFFPQVWKIWTTKSTRDLSWVMVAMFTSGVGLWLIYGILMKSPSITVANSIAFSLWLAIAFMKWRFESRPISR